MGLVVVRASSLNVHVHVSQNLYSQFFTVNDTLDYAGVVVIVSQREFPHLGI